MTGWGCFMGSKYQAYPEYKDSGVEWLGSVPVHWQLTRIKHIAEMTPKKPNIKRDLECSFVPMEKLKTDSIILDETRSVDDVYDGYTYFQNADILMAKVTPCFENKNIAVAKGMVNQIGFGSSEIYVIRVNEKASNRYLYYRLQENSFMDIATAAMTGAGGLKRVPSDVVNNFTAALPSPSEQERIANFLDHETAKIDTLIEKQQQLIKLLKEKRQAVISHAVTKGLNPNAKMRDSGVEWLGEVPEGWQIFPSKQLFPESKKRAALSDQQLSATQDYGVISQVKFMQLAGRRVVQLNHNQELRKRVDVGDFVISMRSFQGGLERAWDEGAIRSSYVVLKPTPNVERNYYQYLLKSVRYIQALQSTANFIRDGQDMSYQNFVLIELPFPPLEEQRSIASFLRRETTHIDQLIDKATQLILLIQERRTALISAAVTGKIDVRDWQAPND